MIRCPSCSEMVVPAWRECDWVETHGLECGPFERCHSEWYECPACGEELTPDDLNETKGESANEIRA